MSDGCLFLYNNIGLTGFTMEDGLLMTFKELIDNAIDACLLDPMYHIELDPRVEVEISEDKECQFVPPDDYALDTMRVMNVIVRDRGCGVDATSLSSIGSVFQSTKSRSDPTVDIENVQSELSGKFGIGLKLVLLHGAKFLPNNSLQITVRNTEEMVVSFRLKFEGQTGGIKIFDVTPKSLPFHEWPWRSEFASRLLCPEVHDERIPAYLSHLFLVTPDVSVSLLSETPSGDIKIQTVPECLPGHGIVANTISICEDLETTFQPGADSVRCIADTLRDDTTQRLNSPTSSCGLRTNSQSVMHGSISTIRRWQVTTVERTPLQNLTRRLLVSPSCSSIFSSSRLPQNLVFLQKKKNTHSAKDALGQSHPTWWPWSDTSHAASSDGDKNCELGRDVTDTGQKEDSFWARLFVCGGTSLETRRQLRASDHRRLPNGMTCDAYITACGGGEHNGGGTSSLNNGNVESAIRQETETRQCRLRLFRYTNGVPLLMRDALACALVSTVESYLSKKGGTFGVVRTLGLKICRPGCNSREDRFNLGDLGWIELLLEMRGKTGWISADLFLKLSNATHGNLQKSFVRDSPRLRTLISTIMQSLFATLKARSPAEFEGPKDVLKRQAKKIFCPSICLSIEKIFQLSDNDCFKKKVTEMLNLPHNTSANCVRKALEEKLMALVDLSDGDEACLPSCPVSVKEKSFLNDDKKTKKKRKLSENSNNEDLKASEAEEEEAQQAKQKKRTNSKKKKVEETARDETHKPETSLAVLWVASPLVPEDLKVISQEKINFGQEGDVWKSPTKEIMHDNVASPSLKVYNNFSFEEETQINSCRHTTQGEFVDEDEGFWSTSSSISS